MARKKPHHKRVRQEMNEPGSGSLAVGYICYGSQLSSPASFEVQKQCITVLAEKKGWKIVHWYEEPGHNAVYESVEQRPLLAQLLRDAESQFQVGICFTAAYWSRRMNVAYPLFDELQRLGVWWATADERWDTYKVVHEGTDIVYASSPSQKNAL
jgi:hypothetical protein